MTGSTSVPGSTEGPDARWWSDPSVYLSVFEQTHDLVVVLDADYRLRYANPATEATFGYERGSVDSVIDLVHPDDIGVIAENLSSGRRVGSSTFRMKAADGSWRWLDATAVDLRDRPDVGALVVVARDITEAKEASAALAESEQRYRSVVETLAEGVIIFDQRGEAVTWNPAALDILGISDDVLSGRTPNDERWVPLDLAGQPIPYDDRPIVVTLRTGEPQRGVLVGTDRRDGRRVWLSVNTTMIPAPDGSVGGVVCGFSDVTELMTIQAAVMASEKRFRTLVAESFDIVLTTNAEGVATYVSPAAERTMGWRPAELVGRSMLEIVHPDDVALATGRLAAILADPDDRQLTRVRVRGSDGEYRSLEVVATNRLDDEAVDGIIINARNITDRLAIEHDLAAEKERYERLLEALPDLVIRYDRDLNVIYANPSARALLETPSATIRSVDIADADVELAISEMRATIETGQMRSYEQPMLIDGEPRWFEVILLPEPDRVGRVEHLMSVARDVTPYKQEEQRLRQQTLEDTLTGLANRTAFEQQLTQALAGLEHHSGVVAVLFLDLDRFKYVNDSLGHHAGDRLLVAVAERFRRAVRPGDLVARFGGDEFAILPDRLASANEAEQLADRIHQLLIEPVRVGDQDLRISTSIGIASADRTHPTSAAGLIQHADLAMYRAKREGRSRTAIHAD